MFGMFSSMFRSSSPAPNSDSVSTSPIMVADYVGTESTSSELRAAGKKIITNDLMDIFNDKVTSKQQLFLDGVIGKNNGTFPVTNPVKDGVYFYAVERKYYKCNKTVSGVINAPDTINFTEFSLFNFKGGVSGITITGAVSGTGKLDEITGMMTVNTSVDYSKITGRPSTLPNPNALTIKLNGGNATTYSGSSAVELNITAASIGAQVAGNYASASHNHDSTYSKLGHDHNDVYFTETEINEKLAGYQPKGDYAAKSHNHNGVYQPVGDYANKSHTHDYLPLAGGTITGNLQLNGYTTVAKDRGLKYLDAEGASHWLIHNNGGTEIGIGYDAADAVPTRVYGTLYVNKTNAVWHAGNFNPSSKADSGHNHDSVYSKLSHDHNSAYSAIGHKHDDLYQPKGSYSLTSHNHDSVYSKLSHDHAGVYQPKGDYANKYHTHNLIDVSIGNMSTAGYVHGLMAPFVPSTKSNKLFGIKPNDIKVEYSTDGGKSWLDYGMDNDTKARLFNEIGSGAVLGKATTKELNTTQGTNSRLRITITSASAGRYVSINKTYIWFSSSGNTCKCSCKVARHGSKTKWDDIWVDKDIAGWSGGNFFNHNNYALQGPDGSSDTNVYAVQYEFWMTKINPNYGGASVSYINGYGDNVWGAGEFPFVENDHLYKWDNDYNMILPAGLTAKGEINGVITKAKQDEQGNVIHTTYAKANHNHDSVYSKLGHNHDDRYFTETEITEKLAGYQPKGSYALASHDHNGVYAPSSHNHSSSNINLLTGYSKPTTTSALTTSDTLNVALGKLEKALDGKQATGNYSVVGHNHNTEYNTKSEITNLLAGKLGKSENAVSASKLATARTIAVSGAVTGSTTFDGSGNATIATTLNGFDASKITSGTISVDRLPKSALSEFFAVKDRAARLALTKSQVQNGDTVKETDTKRMYLVIDDTKLSTDEGYQEYTTVVDWSTITGRPSTFAPSAHNHKWADITDRPSTMVNPNALTISLNGKAQTAYTGAAAVSFNITPASIGAQVAGNYASSSHNHDSVYAKVSHTHSYLPLAGGTMTGDITTKNNGGLKYLDSAGTAKWLIGNEGGNYIHIGYGSGGSNVPVYTYNEIYANGNQKVWHAGNLNPANYQPKGDYAAAGHNHDSVYSKLGHAHAWETITGRPSTFAPSAHNQASSTITTMTGYTKASSVSVITATDSLNVAIGKLEKALDTKQAAGNYATATHNHDDKYQLKGSYAVSGHNHDEVYSKLSHSHAWSAITDKPSTFAPSAHNQASSTINAMTGYSKPSSTAAIAATDTLNDAIGKLEKALDGKQVSGSYAASNHNHSGVYQPVGDYALNSHNHDKAYAAIGHDHSGVYQPVGNYSVSGHKHPWGDLTGVPSSFTPSSHNQASSTINAMTGYTKPSNTSAISAADTLNAAIGKLEKALDGKQASGSYALSSHNHSGVYAPVSHNHTGANITSLTGYKKGTTGAAIGETDSLLVALGKLEKLLDGKQNSGSYASSSHNHDGVYQPVGSYALTSHNHDTQYQAKGNYAAASHNHDSVYAKSSHSHVSSGVTAMTGYTKAATWTAIAATDSLNVAIGKLEKALDSKQAAGSYAASNHNHSGVYAPNSHSHAWDAITGKPSSFTPSSHNQASSTINSMAGYAKPSSTGAIATSDTLNAAIGKLEKALDGKQAAGSYAASNHNHAGVYQPAGSYASSSHNHDSVYAKASHGLHVPATQTANNKIFLRCDNTWHTITPAEIGAQPAGSYAAASHSHSGYAASNHSHSNYLPTSGGTISGALTVTGQILSNADVVAYSDKRMKTNIVKIDSALDKVSAINGYTYDMQGVEFGGQRQAGVIAQELKEVLPEAVITDDNGYFAVRYTNIIPLLIEALKEEKSKRESLEERLAKIERMLDIK